MCVCSNGGQFFSLGWLDYNFTRIKSVSYISLLQADQFKIHKYFNSIHSLLTEMSTSPALQLKAEAVIGAIVRLGSCRVIDLTA